MMEKLTNPASAAWWRGAVVYQIYPRSFQDSNADGVGDLPGITARLDHVSALGVDAIWISPFFKSPMKDFGYDVSDYRDVDPLFGTLADFDALLARAHQLGLRVMIDQVLSHTSDQHAWFQESRLSRDNPKHDWYVWADAKPDGTPPNNWLSVFGGSAWQWDTRRRQYYLHSFLTSQPDLNFHSPAVQDAVLGEVRFWCEKGVDGFRFDACNHQVHDALLRDNPATDGGEVSTVRADNPYAMQRHVYDKSQPENLVFLERLRGVLDEFGAASIGEVGDEHSPPIMADYTEAGKRLHMAYSFSLLTSRCTPAHLRSEVEALEKEIARTGWLGLLGAVEPRRAAHRHALVVHGPGRPATGTDAAFHAPEPARQCVSLPGRGAGFARSGSPVRTFAGSLRHGLLARVQRPRWLSHADALAGAGRAGRILAGRAVAAGQRGAACAGGRCAGSGSGLDAARHPRIAGLAPRVGGDPRRRPALPRHRACRRADFRALIAGHRCCTR